MQIRFFDYRFSWVPLLAFLIAVFGFFVAAFDKILGGSIIALGMVLFVAGAILIVFLPKAQHKKIFHLGSKLIVAGFAFTSLSFGLSIIYGDVWVEDLVYFIGLISIIFGIFISSKRQGRMP